MQGEIVTNLKKYMSKKAKKNGGKIFPEGPTVIVGKKEAEFLAGGKEEVKNPEEETPEKPTEEVKEELAETPAFPEREDTLEKEEQPSPEPIEKVIDDEEVEGLPPMPSYKNDDDRELMRKHRKLVVQTEESIGDEDWTLKTKPTDRNNNLSVWFKPTEEGVTWVKAQLVTSVDLAKIDTVISDTEQWSKFDKVLDKVTTVREFEGAKVVLRLTKGNFMMSARQYCLSLARFELENGSIVHTFFVSEEVDEPDEGIDKGEVYSGAWILKS